MTACPHPKRSLEAALDSRALSDVCANAFNGLLPLREHRGKEVPDVDHLLADLEGDVYPGRFGALCQACRHWFRFV
jgi:hypothetical protein